MCVLIFISGSPSKISRTRSFRRRRQRGHGSDFVYPRVSWFSTTCCCTRCLSYHRFNRIWRAMFQKGQILSSLKGFRLFASWLSFCQRSAHQPCDIDGNPSLPGWTAKRTYILAAHTSTRGAALDTSGVAFTVLIFDTGGKGRTK
jgi:hypothetical protein